MSTRKAPSLDRAADFIWRNARLLERAQFAHAFLGGSADAVRAAVLAYRNPNGGFGNAIEPDVRAPGSIPLHCEFALRSLSESGIRDTPVANEVCEFLASIAEPDGRIPIVLQLIRDYPRASQWSEPTFGGDSPNNTAGLVGLLHYGGGEHQWLSLATEWCWRRLERPLSEAHEIRSALIFLEHASDRSRAQTLALDIASRAHQADWFVMEPGSSKYGLTPLSLCPHPDAIARGAFVDDLIDQHLDDLASRQERDGGWPISWNAPSPGAALEWRGRVTFEALVCLRAWQRT